MARTNRWLGGRRALTRWLYPRLAAAPGPLTVLDLGTGAADTAQAIAHWARRHRRDVRVLGADWAARNLAVARARTADEPRVRLLRADARRLPLAPRSVDFVVSTLFLHHFAPTELVHVLRLAAATAHRGVLMTDLARGWLPLAAFRLVQPIFARHPFTRHDGALSIRRAYTRAELLRLAAAAGLAGTHVHGAFPFRLTLVADLEERPHG
jgi:SAM-dependent methyltransferase